MNLMSTTSRVEAPVIIAKIGTATFGLYNKTKTSVEVFNKYYLATKVTYPNYMHSLTVTKINGALNRYTLTLVYPITANDDPNMIDKILSSVSKSRKLTLTYGDATTPAFMYKEEEALITKVNSQLSANDAKITYTIEAVSTALNLTAGTFSFPRRNNTKPSDVIKELLYNRSYGLLDIFYGMSDKQTVLQSGVILADDRPVDLAAKTSITIFDYLNYLVSCMSPINDSNSSIQKSGRYVLTVHDDVSNTFSGPYFKVSMMVNKTPSTTSIDYYTIDIGYPSKDLVSNFTISDNEAYAILYEYSKDINQTNYIYRIADNGSLDEIYSPAITNSAALKKTTTVDKTWWSNMTQYPISAQITIKGLLRAAILMSYLRVNVYYYGKKYNASGLYIITKQEDKIDTNGYTTTLSLTRIGEDNG